MIRQHGTDEQKQRFLPRMATGETRGAFSMSEPEVGSDVAAIRTRAVPQRRRQDGTLHGQKMWLTNGGSSTSSPHWSAPTKARDARTTTSPPSSSKSPAASAKSHPGSPFPASSTSSVTRASTPPN